MGDILECLSGESRYEERPRLGQGNAARAQIEEMILLEVAGGGAVAADDIIGVNLELGLGIELGGGGEQESVARLLAVGLLRAALDHHFALEDTAGFLVEDAFEYFAAGAMRDTMPDEETGIAMLPVAEQIGPGDLRIGMLAVKT